MLAPSHFARQLEAGFDPIIEGNEVRDNKKMGAHISDAGTRGRLERNDFSGNNGAEVCFKKGKGGGHLQL